MKKLLTGFLTCLIIFASAFTLFACGNAGDPLQAFDKLSTAIQTINTEDENNNMFTTANVNSVKSDYVLRYYLNNSQYNYYNQIFVLPMNFIQKYAGDIERIKDLENISGEKQGVINDLTNSLPAWVDAYRTSAKEYEALRSVGNAPVVAEGMLEIYNRTLFNLFETTYEVALNIAKVKNEVFNDYRSLSETNRVLNENDTITLRDYFLLQLGYDYFNCLIVNLDMEDYSSLSGDEKVREFKNLIVNIKAEFVEVFNLLAKDENQVNVLTGKAIEESIDEEKVTIKYVNSSVDKLFKVLEALDNERIMLNKSLEEFSLYKYYVNYSCNMNAYTEKQAFAENYYKEISDYFRVYSNEYVAYLNQIITK